MVIKIEFSEGVYSSNKNQIKEVFKILEYKYQNAIIISNNLMICNWKRPDGSTIKGIFHGTGKQCEFIIDKYNDNELVVYQSLAYKYQCKINSDYKSDSNNIDLEKKAKQFVDKWWTPVKQYPGEPDLFYKFRKEKELISYNNFIQLEINKLKERNVS